MNSNHNISNEAFSAKEREIALLFGGSSIAVAEPDASEQRVARIVQRARQQPSPEGLARIDRIMQRLAESPPSDTPR